MKLHSTVQVVKGKYRGAKGRICDQGAGLWFVLIIDEYPSSRAFVKGELEEIPDDGTIPPIPETYIPMYQGG